MDKVAIDPGNATMALREMMREAGIDILSNAKIASVLKEGSKITGLQLARGETFGGKQFIDSTVNGELAQLAGIKKLTGYAALGLPDSELSVTLVFETQGLSPETLRNVEFTYLEAVHQPIGLRSPEMDRFGGRRRRFSGAAFAQLANARLWTAQRPGLGHRLY